MATYDLSSIRYHLTAVLPDGTLLALESVAENIAWEENKGELATRLNLTLRDVEVNGQRLAALLPLCTVIYLYADWNGVKTELFRGTVWEWEHSRTDNDAVTVTCYDMLYYLQKSTDSRYYPAGKTTKEICEDILSAWSVPNGGVTVTGITHEKTVYKSKAVSAMLTEALDEAKKKNGEKTVIRADQGKCFILPMGQNAEIWAFDTRTNLSSVQDRYSMTELVTRVVVVGKEDKEGRPKVEATLDGATEYGILQAHQSMSSGKLEDAKKEAQELLDEKGKPERTVTLQAAEVPVLRKGDLIYAVADRLEGYFYVLGVSHNATSQTMQMEVEPRE